MEEIKKEDRGFYWTAKCAYSKYLDGENRDKVTFGIYPEGGNQGTLGEMSMIWEEFYGGKVSPKLICYDDSFHVLNSFSDLMEDLSIVYDTDFTQRDFVALLTARGFKDLTRY